MKMMKDLTYKDSRNIKQREQKVSKNIPLVDLHEVHHVDRHACMAKNDWLQLRTFLMNNLILIIF